MEKIYSEFYTYSKGEIPEHGDAFVTVSAWKPSPSLEERGLPSIIGLYGGHIALDSGSVAQYNYEWCDYYPYEYKQDDAWIVRRAIHLFDESKSE